MIIGNGLVASAFSKKYETCQTFVIYASGVSNSKETNLNRYAKETKLLKDTIKKNTEKTIVYFSTTSIYTSSTPYTEHKKQIESLIKDYAQYYYIFRLPQVVGPAGNPNNLINFFVNQIENENVIHLARNISRSLIDVEDVYKIVDYVINHSDVNQIFDISHVQLKKVEDIIILLEGILSKKANILLKEDEIDCYQKNSDQIEECIQKLNIRHKNYTQSILKKYVEYYRRNSQRPIL